MHTDEIVESIAISEADWQKFGCPFCGHAVMHRFISGSGSTLGRCASCNNPFCALEKGVKRSAIPIMGTSPELQEHPRKGIPRHGAEENQPED